MVYPALTHLADLGEVAETPDGSRKRYAITDTGRMALSNESVSVAAAMQLIASKLTPASQ